MSVLNAIACGIGWGVMCSGALVTLFVLFALLFDKLILSGWRR